jgi:hypothetical protein
MFLTERLSGDYSIADRQFDFFGADFLKREYSLRKITFSSLFPPPPSEIPETSRKNIALLA